MVAHPGRWSARVFKKRRSARAHTRFEYLEARQVLSAANVASLVVAPAATHAAIGPNSAYNNTATPPATANSPSSIRGAYGFNQVAFGGQAADGSGQTIAIVDAYNNPNILSDLDTFDRQFGDKAGGPSLYDQYGPSSSFLSVVNQQGSATGLPQTDSGWAQEIALDVEWAHAIAPGAKIVLVEANSASLGDLLKAVDTAAGKGSVVSMSFGGPEFAGETALDSHFNKPGVTFVASSGDGGTFGGPQWPSVSPNVVSVGGTTLTSSGESAWTGSFFSGGSTGGVSQYESQPGYQAGALGAVSGRTTPDVSYNANPRTGFAVYSSTPDETGHTGWSQVGGTSAGAPQWAALLAIADQGRAVNHLPNLSSAQTLGNLYAGGATGSSPYFHDITTGRSWPFSAGSGYDLLTGLGSPAANVLLPFLSGGATGTTTPPVVVLPTAGTTTVGPVSSTGQSGTTTSGSGTTRVSAADLIADATTTNRTLVTAFVLIVLPPPPDTPPPARNAHHNAVIPTFPSTARIDSSFLSSPGFPNQPLPGSGLRPFRGNTDPIRRAPAPQKGQDDGEEGDESTGGRGDMDAPNAEKANPWREGQPGNEPDAAPDPEKAVPPGGMDLPPAIPPDGLFGPMGIAPGLLLGAFSLAWWRTWRLSVSTSTRAEEEETDEGPTAFRPEIDR
jgi:hypothetical protein